MKIRIDALYSMGLYGKWCKIKGKDPDDDVYLEERWLDLVTVPEEMEDEILYIRKTGGGE